MYVHINKTIVFTFRLFFGSIMDRLSRLSRIPYPPRFIVGIRFRIIKRWMFNARNLSDLFPLIKCDTKFPNTCVLNFMENSSVFSRRNIYEKRFAVYYSGDKIFYIKRSSAETGTCSFFLRRRALRVRFTKTKRYFCALFVPALPRTI